MSAPKRTTQDAADIFDGFVDTLKEIVTKGETVVTEDGEVMRKTPSPAALNVVRQFLKDQNITATSAHKGLASLAAKATALPFSVDEENGDQPTAH
jgi:hypothetical protein